MECARIHGHAQWTVIAEIAAFVAFALLSKYLISFLFWRYAGPASLLLTLGLLTLYMRATGLRWLAMGLVPLRGWKPRLMVVPQAGLTLLAFAAVVALTTVVGPAIGLAFLSEVPAGVGDRWGDVAGSLRHPHADVHRHIHGMEVIIAARVARMSVYGFMTCQD